MAKIPTEGHPPLLFYLAGTTAWNYFSTCLSKTATTFTANANLFGKVYFPRLITPISIVVSSLVQFSIQFILFAGIWIYYLVTGSGVDPDWFGIILLTPVLVVLMGLLGLGCGITISSLTSKYRDFHFLVNFGIQLMMYGTPVIYSLNIAPEKYRPWIEANPMSPIIECFRGIYLGSGVWNAHTLGYATVVTLAILALGLLLFNRISKTFMDTV
jgi:lipopolysaccharide transport system permease protein